MVLLPLPFIRSIGIGGMLIPAVSVIAAITLLPALLSVLGTRINSVRLLPKRLVDTGHPEDGWWGRWANLVMRRPLPIDARRARIVGVLLFYGLQLNPSEAQAKDFPGSGDAIAGLQALADAGISPGVMKPFVVLVEHGADRGADVAKLDADSGRRGRRRTAPPELAKGEQPDRGVPVRGRRGEAGARRRSATSAHTLKGTRRHARRRRAGGPRLRQRGLLELPVRARVRDPALTFILLSRAFRSLVLALKAVILNLISLGAAYGIIVFIFQQGHGSEAIWNVAATQAIISWIPLMIFAFLFGLSMDYEVFMLSRMREAYDETGDTVKAISLGLARTGKLVTSAALVLMFAFIVLSSSPGTDIKQFGIGLAAGIIFDATIIRALLVPSIMRLLGDWNWYLPNWAARALFLKPEPPVDAGRGQVAT